MSNVSDFAMSHETHMTKHEQEFGVVVGAATNLATLSERSDTRRTDIACQRVNERRLTITFDRSIIETQDRFRGDGGKLSERERDVGKAGRLISGIDGLRFRNGRKHRSTSTKGMCGNSLDMRCVQSLKGSAVGRRSHGCW